MPSSEQSDIQIRTAYRSLREDRPWTTVFLLQLAIVICLLFWNLSWELPNYRSPAGDNTTIDGLFMHEGKDLMAHSAYKYPPYTFIQNYVVAAITRPFAKGEPIDIATTHLFASRIPATLYMFTAMLAIMVTAGLLHGRWYALLFGAIWILNPVILYYGHTSNVEAPSIAFLTMAICLVCLRLKNKIPAWTTAFAFVFASLSVLSKDQAAFALILPCLVLIWKDRKFGLIGAALAPIIAFVLYSITGLDTLAKHLSTMHAIAEPFKEYSSGPIGCLLLTGLMIKQLAMQSPLLVLLFGFLVVRKCWPSPKDILTWTCLAGALAYLIAILFMANRSYDRYVLPFHALGIVCLLTFSLPTIQKPTLKWSVPVGIAIVIVGIYSSLIIWKINASPRMQARVAITNWVKEKDLAEPFPLGMFTRVSYNKVDHYEDGKPVFKSVSRDWHMEQVGFMHELARSVTGGPDALPLMADKQIPLIIMMADDGVDPPYTPYKVIADLRSPLPWYFPDLYRQHNVLILEHTEYR